MAKKDKNKNSKVIQIVGGLIAILAILMVALTNWPGLNIKVHDSVDVYASALLGVATYFLLFLIGGLLLFKKSIPKWFSYATLVVMTIWAMNLNLGTNLEIYKHRSCESVLISDCPLVSNEIKLLFLSKLAIFIVGLLIGFWIYRSSNIEK